MYEKLQDIIDVAQWKDYSFVTTLLFSRSLVLQKQIDSNKTLAKPTDADLRSNV